MHVVGQSTPVSCLLLDLSGSTVTSGVSCYILSGTGSLTASSNTPTHKGRGVWQLIITAAEHDSNYMAVLFEPSDARLAKLIQFKSATNSAIAADIATVAHTYTATAAGTGLAIPDVYVECRARGASISTPPIGAGRTNSSGQIVFYLQAGNYDFYPRKAGYDFGTLPDQETVA